MRLSPVSYVVLGLIGLRGPSTPYQLKKAAERSVSCFWPFPHSQLYSEPERLAAAGLLSREVEEGGRHRKLYALTEAGRASLAEWLSTPPEEIFELRDMAILQLFLGEFARTEDLVELARSQVRLFDERLSIYRGILAKHQGQAGASRRMAPLALGFRMAEVCKEFWQEIADNPPPAPDAEPTDPA